MVNIVVVGAFGYDTNVYLHSNHISQDREMDFLEILDFPSHAGIVSATSYAKLGADVAVLGRIGEDSQGAEVVNHLERYGIDVSGLQLDPKGTKRSVNLIFQNGSRRGFYDGKSSMEQTLDMDLTATIIEGADLIHVNIVNWAREIFDLANSRGILTAVDLQDVTDPADPYRLDFVQMADFIFFSATNLASTHDMLEQYRENNDSAILIAGLGSDGCLLQTREFTRKYRSLTLADPVLDTTGAGDSLATGFLLSYLQNYDWDACVLRGQLNARYTCTYRGAHTQLLDQEGWERLYQQRDW